MILDNVLHGEKNIWIIVLYILGYFYWNKQNSYAALTYLKLNSSFIFVIFRFVTMKLCEIAVFSASGQLILQKQCILFFQTFNKMFSIPIKASWNYSITWAEKSNCCNWFLMGVLSAMSDHLSLPTTFCVSRWFLYSKCTAICDHLYNATTRHDLCATGLKLTCQWATTNIKNVVPTRCVAGRSVIRFTIMLLCSYSLSLTVISMGSFISLFFI